MNSLTLFKFSPLPLRILVGIGLIFHGIPKIIDTQSTEGFFSTVGLPPELAVPIGLLEVIGWYLHSYWYSYTYIGWINNNRNDWGNTEC